jgi:tripartite-type tricarboxylate transporter receptor subunit TctC
MKKIIITLLAAFSVAMTTTAWASPQTVNLVWPFAAGSVQAAKVRALIETANSQQDQYRFIFTHRPGAGGAVGTIYTANAASLTVLATSSSFYTRPLMYHNSYDIDQFRLISTICSKSPLALLSRKYTSAGDLKNNSVTVSNNPGAITQLFTQILAQTNPDIRFTEVPYPGTVEGIRDMMGGHIDISVDLGTDPSRLAPGVNVLGITGTRSLPNMPTLARQGLRGVENLTIDYFIFVPRSVDDRTAQQLNQIFNQAAVGEAVGAGCANQSGVVEITEFSQLERVNRSNQARWRFFTKDIDKQ